MPPSRTPAAESSTELGSFRDPDSRVFLDDDVVYRILSPDGWQDWLALSATPLAADDRLIATEPVELDGWPMPVPSLMTDIVLSMDDRALYVSNWLHGDLHRYDVSDPANPELTGRLWLGGLLGKPSDAGRELSGGPQMMQQLSQMIGIMIGNQQNLSEIGMPLAVRNLGS